MLLERIANSITIVLISGLALFALLDNLLIFLAKTLKPQLKNKYFDFHKRYGILRVTLLKVILSLFLVYALIEPVGKSGAIAAIIWAYGFFVTKLLIDLIKNQKNAGNDRSEIDK